MAIAPLAQAAIGQYDLLELSVQTSIPTSNPFDPNQLDIRVQFTSPSGREIDVGAFWYRDFNPSTRQPIGDPGWRVRFTPTEAGTWTAVARIPALGIESDPVAFQVNASDHPGFVRVHPTNPRYLAFDNGDFFFPIGINMIGWGGASEAMIDFPRWIDAFSANGGNTLRVWMASRSFAIEWTDTPLGDYTNRLEEAWLLDQVFRMAEERDMQVILVLLVHCMFSEWRTCEWDRNPYNAVLGGPLTRPEEFATDPAARTLFQRRLNYVVNRWGYSPNLLA